MLLQALMEQVKKAEKYNTVIRTTGTVRRGYASYDASTDTVMIETAKGAPQELVRAKKEGRIQSDKVSGSSFFGTYPKTAKIKKVLTRKQRMLMIREAHTRFKNR